MIIGDLDQLVRLKSGQLINATSGTRARFDKDGRRHYTIRAIHTKISSERLSG
jgi:hypothetical protein